MPKYKRYKTKYPGVYFIRGTSQLTGKQEKIYYIYYRVNGRIVEEKAGRQYKDDMTPARAALQRASKIERSIPPNKNAQNDLNSLWERYREDKKNIIKSIANDTYRYKKYIRGTLGNKTPLSIQPSDFDKYNNELENKIKPQTIKHIFAQIQRIINYGASRGLCSRLSFQIEMPKFDNRKTEDLTQKQLKRLLNVLEEEPYIEVANFMKIALFTGMRKSEIIRLQWKDIDFERGFILIREPKGVISQYIPLNKYTRSVLESHPRKSGINFIFPNKKGQQRYRTSFDKPLRRIKKIAGLPEDFRPAHGLRHVYASMLASSGNIDMYTLQKLLTHKSPLMTQRYAHLRDEAFKRASDFTDNIIDTILEKT
ncbi:tyrosine-type recombinase/integrase [Candidatus Latescibacterota bacterium]